MEPKQIRQLWIPLDLGPGELAAMSLAWENPSRIVLLDDALARREAQKAGLTVWGTLRILLESKRLGTIPEIKPAVRDLRASGMWISDAIESRILDLAGEQR